MTPKYYYAQLYQITLGGLCFGLVIGRWFNCRTDVVVDVAPVAKWCMDGKAEKILDYWKGRGAKIYKYGI